MPARHAVWSGTGIERRKQVRQRAGLSCRHQDPCRGGGSCTYTPAPCWSDRL